MTFSRDDSVSADGKDLVEKFFVEVEIKNSQPTTQDPQWETEELPDSEKEDIENLYLPSWFNNLF